MTPNGQQQNPWGNRIRERRTHSGWTQQQLADDMQVRVLTIKNWENHGIPEHATRIIEYLFGSPELLEPHNEVAHQLQLPFGEPVDLELRISPQRADTIHIAVQWRGRAAG